MCDATIHLFTENLTAFGIEEIVSVSQSPGHEAITELPCQRPGHLLAIEVTRPIAGDGIDPTMVGRQHAHTTRVRE